MGRLRFIIGRAGSGKTHFCLSEISDQLKQSPLSGPSLILLVPEQTTFQMNRQLAEWKDLRGFLRARVVSFRSLARETVGETLPSKRSLMDVSRQFIMQRIISEHRNDLKFWKLISPKHLSGSVVRILDELKQADMTSAKLDEIRSSLSEKDQFLSDKLADLVRLENGYSQILSELNLDDSKNLIDYFRKLIGTIEWFKGARIWIDGFSGFTGQEYAALAAMMETAEQIDITLSLDADRLNQKSGDSETLFELCRTTWLRLMDIAKKSGVPVDPAIILEEPSKGRFSKSLSLSKLERFSAGAIKDTDFSDFKPDGESIRVVSAENPIHEVQLAAGRILKLVQEDNYRFRDISIILRDLNEYSNILRYVFRQHDIPFFVDARRSISHHPLTTFILSTIGILSNDFDTGWMLRYLKTGLAGVLKEDSDRIEYYVLEHGITGEKWRDDWNYGRLSRVEDSSCENEEKFGETLNKKRRKIVEQLLAFEKDVGIDRNRKQEFLVNHLIRCLMTFLNEMNVKKTLADWADSLKPDDPTEKRIHRQIWEKVESLFDQLGVIYSNQDVTLEEFLEILTQSFTEITIGVIPPTADQVLIGTIDRMRHPAIRASFILGFNETIWPAPMNEDVLLCDEERLKLKSADLPLTGDVETHFLRERYFVYTAFTRPSEKLWISYSRKDSGGSPLQPSRYLKTLTDFATVQTFYPADADHLAEKPDDLEDEMNQIPLTEYQLFSRAVLSQNVNLSESGKTFWKHLAGVLSERELMADYTKRIVETISNRNMAKLERDLAIKLFSERISFSKIETYYKCPFQFFLVYGLQLAEKPRYLLEPADMGEFRHAVMKSAWKDLVGGSDETSQEIIERASKRAAETIRDQVLFETARNRYILEKIIAELVTALDGQRRMMEGGNIYPAEFEKEVSFSMDDGPHSCVLVGRIDRVDISRENESRLKVVVDYKAKGMMFDFVSWHAGTQLQLPGYLYLETRENFVPAGAVYMALEPSRPGSQNKHLFPISGIFSKESVERLYNQTSEQYPYQIKEGKEGIVSRGNVHVLDEAVFTNLLDKTFEMVKKSVSEFMSGDITITPFYHKKRSACMFCRKQSVCRFDSFVNKYRTISLKTKDEILTELS